MLAWICSSCQTSVTANPQRSHLLFTSSSQLRVCSVSSPAQCQFLGRNCLCCSQCLPELQSMLTPAFPSAAASWAHSCSTQASGETFPPPKSYSWETSHQNSCKIPEHWFPRTILWRNCSSILYWTSLPLPLRAASSLPCPKPSLKSQGFPKAAVKLQESLVLAKSVLRGKWEPCKWGNLYEEYIIS